MKTVSEWLHEFNLLINNINSNKAPGYEPYEISTFLTRSQEAVVIGLCTGSISPESFESSEAITSYLDSLVRQATLQESQDDMPKIDDRKSYIFELPDDLLFRTLETCKITTPDCGTVVAEIVPTTQDEILKRMRNPFRKQNGRRVLRLSYSSTREAEAGEENPGLNEARYSELISDYAISEYIVRYIEKPSPIIVADLPTGYSINGESTAMTCLLPEQLHQLILERAVQMAKSVWNN